MAIESHTPETQTRTSTAPVAPAPALTTPPAAATGNGGQGNPYARLFHASIERGLAQSLERVEAAEPLVPLPVRQQAWHLLSYSLRLPGAWPLTRDLLLALAPKMEQEGLRDEWIPYLEGGVAQSRALGDGGAEAELCFRMGYLWRLRGDFGRASEWLTVSKRIFEKRREQKGVGRALTHLANIVRLQGNHNKARCYLHDARMHLPESDPELAMIYYVLGMIAIDESNLEEAEHHHRLSHAIWSNWQDRRKVAWGAQNVGLVLRGKGRYSEAANFYQQAIDIMKEERDSANQAIAQMNLGIVYSLQNQPEKALRLYTQSEEIFRNVQDQWHLAMLYNSMTIDLRKLEKWQEAERICRKGIELFAQQGELRWRINMMDELGLVLLGHERYSKSVEVFQNALDLLDNLHNRPGHHRLLELLTQHLYEALQKLEQSSLSENCSGTESNHIHRQRVDRRKWASPETYRQSDRTG